MSDLDINGHTVISSDGLDEYDDIDSTSGTLTEKNEAARKRLEAMLRRAGVTISNISATNAGELQELGVAIWLEAYWAERFQGPLEDEGFASKREYWESKVQQLRADILGDPVQLTGISSDRPKGDLRAIKSSV